MITENQYTSNGKFMGAVTLYGLSTDTKPVSVGNGSVFIEIDNVGKKDESGNAVNAVYMFDAENATWYPEIETNGGDT